MCLIPFTLLYSVVFADTPYLLEQKNTVIATKNQNVFMALKAKYSHFISCTYIELHFAGGRCVFGFGGKPPYCFEMAEEGSIGAHSLFLEEMIIYHCSNKSQDKDVQIFILWRSTETSIKSSAYPDLVVWDEGDIGRIALQNGGETYFQFCPEVAILFFNDPRPLAPRDKVLVLVHIDHHVVHLLWSVPEHTIPRNGGGVSNVCSSCSQNFDLQTFKIHISVAY